VLGNTGAKFEEAKHKAREDKALAARGKREEEEKAAADKKKRAEDEVRAAKTGVAKQAERTSEQKQQAWKSEGLVEDKRSEVRDGQALLLVECTAKRCWSGGAQG
jgi:membrane protein involved in colicin uptake